jgi:hypothetical protein
MSVIEAPIITPRAMAFTFLATNASGVPLAGFAVGVPHPANTAADWMFNPPFLP